MKQEIQDHQAQSPRWKGNECGEITEDLLIKGAQPWRVKDKDFKQVDISDQTNHLTAQLTVQHGFESDNCGKR